MNGVNYNLHNFSLLKPVQTVLLVANVCDCYWHLVEIYGIKSFTHAKEMPLLAFDLKLQNLYNSIDFNKKSVAIARVRLLKCIGSNAGSTPP